MNENNFPWKRNLYILWVAQCIAMIGMSSCIPFLPLYILQLGVQDLAEAQKWSGLVYSAPFFLSFLITPIWGVLGDKYGRKLMVVRALFGLMSAMLLMGLVRNVWQLFLLRIFQGGVSGFIAANLSLVSSSSPKEQSGYAIAFLQTSTAVGMTLGPLFGGALADGVGIRNVFFVVAAFCFLSAVIVILLVREKKGIPRQTKANLIEDLGFVWANPSLRHFLCSIFLSQAGIIFSSPIFAYYLQKLHTPPRYLATVTGIMVGCVGVLTVICSPMWGKKNDRDGYEKTLKMAIPFLAFAMVAHSLVSHYFYLFPLRVIVGIFSSAMVPTLYAAISKNSPEEMRGEIMGFASSATVLGNLVGPLLCSWIASQIGMEWTFVASGALIGTVYLAISSPANSSEQDELPSSGKIDHASHMKI